MTDDLLAIFDSLGQPRVLVLGDLILDQYTFGDAERISQEAPVLVLRATEREARLGGAGNVCNMLRGLQAHVTCAGVVGDDSSGRTTRALLIEAGVQCDGVLEDPSRPTTVKERFIGRAQGRHPHQILRVDCESRAPLNADLEQQLAERIFELVESHDVLLISDYDKGVCTPRLLRRAIEAARSAGIPVVVDPVRGNDYSRYRGATTMTPNRTEASLATGISIESSDDAFRAGHKLCRELKLDMAIVTLDRDGMALVMADGTAQAFPTNPRAVYDITGAGDIVLAMIGLALAAGIDPASAVRLGNVAGGLEVEKVGVAVIPRDEIRARIEVDRPGGRGKVLPLDGLSIELERHRAAGRRIVFTNGCFDLLHVGHVTYLEEAAAQGDLLVVGVNSDASVQRLKGPARPVINAENRMALLAALSMVDFVISFEDDTPRELIQRLRPDVLVKGGDYEAAQVVGFDIVSQYGGRVYIAGLVDGVSTTRIVDSLKKTQSLPPTPHFQHAATPRRVSER